MAIRHIITENIEKAKSLLENRELNGITLENDDFVYAPDSTFETIERVEKILNGEEVLEKIQVKDGVYFGNQDNGIFLEDGKTILKTSAAGLSIRINNDSNFEPALIEDLCRECTYNELVGLKNNNSLITGTRYCITDYETNYRLYLRALGGNVLSEDGILDEYTTITGTAFIPSIHNLIDSYEDGYITDWNDKVPGTREKPAIFPGIICYGKYTENPADDGYADANGFWTAKFDTNVDIDTDNFNAIGGIGYKNGLPALYETRIGYYQEGDEYFYGGVCGNSHYEFYSKIEVDGTVYDLWTPYVYNRVDYYSDTPYYLITNEIVVENENRPKTLRTYDIKYILHSDPSRSPLNETNTKISVPFKGIILWMKDEHNNEAPFDFATDIYGYGSFIENDTCFNNKVHPLLNESGKPGLIHLSSYIKGTCIGNEIFPILSDLIQIENTKFSEIYL